MRRQCGPVGDVRVSVPSRRRRRAQRAQRRERPGKTPHPLVVEALAEFGIDASGHVPHKLDADDLAWADIAISTCSEEVCPVTPGVRRISWVFTDPKNLPLEQVRFICDEIAQQVERLVHELGSEG